MASKGGEDMSYKRFLIDASSQSPERRKLIWEFLCAYSDIHCSRGTGTGIFEVFWTPDEVCLANSDELNGCKIVNITQESHI